MNVGRMVTYWSLLHHFPCCCFIFCQNIYALHSQLIAPLLMHPSPSILSTQALLLCSLRHLPGLVVGRAMNNPVDVTHKSLRRSASAQMRRATTNSLLSFVLLSVVRCPLSFVLFPCKLSKISLCSQPLLKGYDRILAGTDLHMGLATYRSTITA